MSTNNPTTIIRHSLYWLLPVILLNVFTSASLLASVVELPFQVQTEQLFGGEQPTVSTYLAPASSLAKLAAAPIWPGLILRSLQVSTYVVSSIPSAHPTAKSLLRFYGKAAPEALDAWSGL